MTSAARTRDCSFDQDGRWFRFRAAAIILRDGWVLMARNDRDDYLYSVGGGVHHGETAEDAVRREVLEETGVPLEVDRLAFIHENFFTDSSSQSLAGKSCHELTFYYLMRYDPRLTAVEHQSTTLDGVWERMEWVPLDGFGQDRLAYPTFFATELARNGDCPRVIVTRE
ncbi:NUDIX domain-containing protein [Luteococcus sp. H138]|uniref:NUDIX hydrolase n=1 Tax=unclassified Luteococcus TaxID=2639923 RepID=UPI00313B16F9